MSFNHSVAWLDHAEAHIIDFNRETSESKTIKTHSMHPHLHIKSGIPGSGHVTESTQYFDDIAETLKDSLEILIVGPGLEKLAFMKYLLKHTPCVAEKVVSVETVDHPSDGQLLAYARKYFVKADQLR